MTRQYNTLGFNLFSLRQLEMLLAPTGLGNDIPCLDSGCGFFWFHASYRQPAHVTNRHYPSNPVRPHLGAIRTRSRGLSLKQRGVHRSVQHLGRSPLSFLRTKPFLALRWPEHKRLSQDTFREWRAWHPTHAVQHVVNSTSLLLQRRQLLVSIPTPRFFC